MEILWDRNTDKTQPTYLVLRVDIQSTIIVNQVPPWHSAGYFTHLGNPSSFIHFNDLAGLAGSRGSAKPFSLFMYPLASLCDLPNMIATDL